jgi:hypothetical protein
MDPMLGTVCMYKKSLSKDCGNSGWTVMLELRVVGPDPKPDWIRIQEGKK